MDFPPPDLPLALLLEFDGTLSASGPSGALPELPPAAVQTLLRASVRFGGALAVISDRDIRDLSLRIPQAIWRLGNHGADVRGPRAAPPDATPSMPEELIFAVQTLAGRNPGVTFRVQGRTITVECPPEIETEAVHTGLDAAVRGVAGYVLRSGKGQYVLAPRNAHTGAALQQLMSRRPFRGRIPLMVSRDADCEDAMLMALQLGGYAIKVGAGQTVAPSRVESPAAVWQWLERVAWPGRTRPGVASR